MTFAKLPTTTQDHAIGIQSVRQAEENNADIKTHLDVRHALGNGGFNTSSFVNPLNAIGRHDDVLVARTVVKFAIDTTLLTPALVPLTAGPMLRSLAFRRLASGQWQIFVAIGGNLVGVAQMSASATVDYRANAYRFNDPFQGQGFIVTTWEQDGGTWAKADLPFDLVLWATT